MLAYVTVTRARTVLDRSGLAWVDQYGGGHARRVRARGLTDAGRRARDLAAVETWSPDLAPDGGSRLHRDLLDPTGAARGRPGMRNTSRAGPAGRLSRVPWSSRSDNSPSPSACTRARTHPFHGPGIKRH